MMDEAVWIERAMAGDVDAFGRLVQHYQGAVYNLAYRMLGERMEAEDAAQEAFLRAFRHLRRYDPARPFRTWLLAIAANLCIDRLRRQRPVVELERVVLQATLPGPEAALAQRQAQERVQQLLLTLPPESRAAVTLRYWYDCSYEEIAAMTGMTESAVKARLHRARRDLARLLEGTEDVL